MGGKSVAGLSSCEATVERGGGGVATAQLLILAGGGAMGEAMRPARMHAGERDCHARLVRISFLPRDGGAIRR